MVGRRTLVHFIALLMFFIAAGATGRGQDSKIWSGVYSSEQAEQGKKVFESNCATCHRSDLTGDRGPSLVGDRFFTSWQAGSVNRLYSKIKETMPPNNRNSNLTEDNVLSLVAFILESNTFPPSKDDTLLTTEVIEDIIIARRDGTGPKGLANFALVQVVGCLAQGPDKQWRLTNSSEPVLTKDQPATPQELQEGLDKPLGTDTFVLQSVARFKPETYQGQKMAAKGLVNFALVQVVCCLAQGPDKQWRLTNTSQPVLTKDQPATAQELQADLAKPLGTDTFVLHSVTRFKPETYQGQKMAAKGLVYMSPNDSLISLTSLQVVDSKCGS